MYLAKKMSCKKKRGKDSYLPIFVLRGGVINLNTVVALIFLFIAIK